eukprot:1343174-Alexandrium_andersonii.AAC.1
MSASLVGSEMCIRDRSLPANFRPICVISTFSKVYSEKVVLGPDEAIATQLRIWVQAREIHVVSVVPALEVGRTG